MTGFVVYYLRDKTGKVIYVGSTTRAVSRIRYWSRLLGSEIASVELVKYDDADTMLAAESSAIRRLNPRHNQRGRTDLTDRIVNRWGVAAHHRKRSSGAENRGT